MPLVTLRAGEMVRDVEGLRDSSISLRPGTWVEMTEEEVKRMESDPILAPRLLIHRNLEPTGAYVKVERARAPEPELVEVEQPLAVHAPDLSAPKFFKPAKKKTK